jgi:hypothetical protein
VICVSQFFSSVAFIAMLDFRTRSDCSGGFAFGGVGVVVWLGVWWAGVCFLGLGGLAFGGVWWVGVVVLWGVVGGCERNHLSCLGTLSCFTLLVYSVNCWEPVLAERRNILSCIVFAMMIANVLTWHTVDLLLLL